MFTGIVQAVGCVSRIEAHASGRRLVIGGDAWQSRSGTFLQGDSVCVSGVCLTLVEDAPSGCLSFDVIVETLARSTLGQLKVGDRVNLESSLTPQTAMGGHFVQGHVDGVGTVVGLTRSSNQETEYRLTIEPGVSLMSCMVPKGSVCIDGVSLTLASVTQTTFEVALIPTTLEKTTLGQLRVGSQVNLETDILARTVIHWLERSQGGGLPVGDVDPDPVTMDKLRKAGFVR